MLATAAGPAVAYSIDLITFVISLFALWMMRATPPPLNADRPSLRSLIEGLRYARSRPELMGTYLIDMNAMFFGMPMALFPAIATKFGGASVGLLYAAPSVGAFLPRSRQAGRRGPTATAWWRQLPPESGVWRSSLLDLLTGSGLRCFGLRLRALETW